MGIKRIAAILLSFLLAMGIALPVLAQNNPTPACTPDEIDQVVAAAESIGLEALANQAITSAMPDQEMRSTAYTSLTAWLSLSADLPRCTLADQTSAQIQSFLTYIQLAPTYSQLGMFSEAAGIMSLGSSTAQDIIANIFANEQFASDEERFAAGADVGDQLISLLAHIEGVSEVGLTAVIPLDDGTHIVSVEAITSPGAETLETAELLYEEAANLVTISEFYSILDDCVDGAVDFGWSAINPEWRVTPLSLSACN